MTLSVSRNKFIAGIICISSMHLSASELENTDDANEKYDRDRIVAEGDLIFLPYKSQNVGDFVYLNYFQSTLDVRDISDRAKATTLTLSPVTFYEDRDFYIEFQEKNGFIDSRTSFLPQNIELCVVEDEFKTFMDDTFGIQGYRLSPILVAYPDLCSLDILFLNNENAPTVYAEEILSEHLRFNKIVKYDFTIEIPFNNQFSTQTLGDQALVTMPFNDDINSCLDSDDLQNSTLMLPINTRLESPDEGVIDEEVIDEELP